MLGNRKKIAKFLMRTFTCRSTFLYGFIPPYGAQVVTSVVDVPEEVCDLNLLTFIPPYIAQVVTSVVDIPEEVCDLNPLTFIPNYIA